jgi:hypothetical protein
MTRLKLYGLFVSFLSIIMFLSCSDLGGSGAGGSGAGGTGTLSLSLTDASTDEYQAVYITIDEVQVHLRGNETNPNSWQSIDMYDSPLTVNLLELVNGVREELGIAELPAGHYTQMRLIIGNTPDDPNLPYANFVIDNSNPPVTYPLKIPSGTQTGEKIVGGFDINANQTTELILDIDACRSVVKSAGNSGKWLLKPTVKIANLEEYGIINGAVTDFDDDFIEGAMVSAQFFDDTSSTDEKDWVTIRASTITDRDGRYKLFVAPGTYNLVVYTDGKDPEFREVVVESGVVYDGVDAEDFQLENAVNGIGTVEGEVTLPGATDEQFATLSFRQTVNMNEMIEIKALNVLNDSQPEYQTSLPAGNYRIVASSVGYSTVTEDVTVTDEGTTIQHIIF